MARWKLTEPHYLTVDGTKWEYTETDRITGRPKRTQFPVPLYLDPMSLDDLKQYGQLDPFMGENADPCIVVITDDDSRKNVRDVLIQSGVTPGMLPIDEEAKQITAEKSKGLWDPTRGIDPESQNESFSNRMLSGLIDKMTEARESTQAQAVPGMSEMMATFAKMMQQQTEILATLAAKPTTTPPARKVA